MLQIPQDSSTLVNIIGIDPGSTTLGVGVLTVNMITLKIVSSTAWTFNGAKLNGNDSWVSEIHGDRTGRILSLENSLLRTFVHYQPMCIICESPFIKARFPQAGIALTEVVAAIRRAVMHYDIWTSLDFVDPPTVKKAVGAHGKSQKYDVRKKVLALKELCYNGEIPIELLDEHSIDALAVAYHRLIILRARCI